MSTTRIKQLAVVLATSSIAFVLIEPAPAASAHEPHVTARPPTRQMPAIVLVHGAFTDASGWADVIHILLEKGFNVTAVQNPLTGYAQDVATTRRLIAAQTGPVVVVGHA
jgi:pimeloyl-ACP methyl ester carboxylesterase